MRAPRGVLDAKMAVATSHRRKGATWALLQTLLRRRFVVLPSVLLMIEFEAMALRPEQLEITG
jgi:hypothetical protein